MTGNAQLSLVTPMGATDHQSTSNAAVNAPEAHSKKEGGPLWMSMLFWTAVAALAGVAGAVAAYL
ncbi:hypothetical protein OG689_44090 [Kitasatospora sp. NBC_00240]|uniref:hypothetical protein n=1 Tax=Kitasatospora sp. NBC_00240 TaxID=2903567 RepID=UPI00225C1DE4|nr:hypothetical protein [Kitasatospora sp. NBC_00240]MCX5216118.1 hypothetical protein [Kitasatospora sp. NBC_00240]